MTTASGIGSWPGTDVREVVRLVRDTLASLGSGSSAAGGASSSSAADVRGLPYLPELPQRGPGADLLGRTAGLLVQLPVDLQPSGWRLTDRPGRDAARTATLLGQDLDELAEAYDGWSGPLKLQVCGPWTLAAGLWLPRGDRVLTDDGATPDLIASLAEGVREHLATVRRLVPGAALVLQLDEPSLPGVLEGGVPTSSGVGRVRTIDPQDALAGLRDILTAAVDAGSTTVVHCCAPGAPLPLLRRTGAALALDTTLLTPRGWEGLAVAIEEGEEGRSVYAGCVPTDGSAERAATLADGVSTHWHELGLDPARLDDLVVTPACGLGTLTMAAAREAHRRTLEVATELTERASGLRSDATAAGPMSPDPRWVRSRSPA